MGMIESLVQKGDNEYDDCESVNWGFVDTGSFLLNAQQSGSIYGGFPESKIIAIAGEKSTGKTFMLLKMVKLFLKKSPQAEVIYFESEMAVFEETMQERGIDISRVSIRRVRTIQQFQFQIAKIIKRYRALPKDEKAPLLICLDSLGMLNTDQELEKLEEGDDKADMGARAKLIKRVFRNITLELGVAGIPLLVTNHTYKEQGAANPAYAKTIMSGGQGLYYSATSVVHLSKRKDRDKKENEVVGVYVRCYNEKCRDAKENTESELRISYKHGLSRFHGLLDLAAEFELIKKTKDGRFEFPGHKPQYEKSIYSNTKKYFTEEFLTAVDQACKAKFTYGNEEESAEEA